MAICWNTAHSFSLILLCTFHFVRLFVVVYTYISENSFKTWLFFSPCRLNSGYFLNSHATHYLIIFRWWRYIENIQRFEHQYQSHNQQSKLETIINYGNQIRGIQNRFHIAGLNILARNKILEQFSIEVKFRIK